MEDMSKNIIFNLFKKKKLENNIKEQNKVLNQDNSVRSIDCNNGEIKKLAKETLTDKNRNTTYSAFQPMNVYTHTNLKDTNLTEKILSHVEKEKLKSLLDSFFSQTEKDAKEYRKELEAVSGAGRAFARRIRGESIIAVKKEMPAFDYHDRFWYYYEVLTAEKITHTEYEFGIKSIKNSDSTEPLSIIAESAEECHVYYTQKLAKGFLDGYEVNWSKHAIAYMTGFDTLQGYYRFVYAVGDDSE